MRQEMTAQTLVLVTLGLALPGTAYAQTSDEPQQPRSNWVFEPPTPAPEPPPAAPAPEEAQPEPDSEPAGSGLIANNDPSNGPPEALLPDPEDESYSPSGGYVNKEKAPYTDAFAAWGWSNNSYLVTISVMNMYLRGARSRFAFHGRMLALGALSFEQRNLHADGTSSQQRRTSFVLEVFDPGMRIYLLGPVFFAFNVDFGMTFYDALVPTLDLQSGLGFDFHGWGLESGVRTSRLPRDQVVVNGHKFFDDRYGLQVYLAIETNIHF
jgi:hypothetical protein